MPQNNQIERIDQYHSGNMSPEEIASFENELAADPSLKAESDFQSTIINGIKEYRKTQLKARLNAIDVSPGWMEFAQQSALVKSFGGIAVATAIGSGVYFFADNKPAPTGTTDAIVEMQGPVENLFAYNWEIPEASPAKEPIKENTPVTSEGEPESKEVAQIEEQKEAINKESKQEAFAPDFSAPIAEEVVDNTGLSASDLDELPAASEVNDVPGPIEVETKNSKGTKIRYKYYDGKLFLNGNFNKEPYEILEINSAKGRRIYLLHQNKYYEVKINDRLSELPEVTDIKLIQELRLIKANK